MSPLTVLFVDLSVLALSQVYLRRFVRENTMRSLPYVVRRSRKQPGRESIDSGFDILL